MQGLVRPRRLGSWAAHSLSLAFLAVLAGCRTGVAGCEEDADCTAESRCIEGACRIPCNIDPDCPEVHRCEGGVCEPGGRPIAAVLDGADAIDHDALSAFGYDLAQVRWYSTLTADFQLVVGTCAAGTLVSGENASGVSISNRPLTSTVPVGDLSAGDNEVRICVDANGVLAELTLPFVRDETAPVSVASPLPGTHVAPLALTFACADRCDRIAYTTDGVDPQFGASGALLTGTLAGEDLVLSTTTLLKYRAIDLAGNVEAVREGLYDLEPPPLITVDAQTHAGLSPSGYLDTTITWRTSRAGDFTVQIGGCTEPSADVLRSGSALADTAQDSTLAVTDFPVPGEYAVWICVSPELGVAGSTSVVITRDDSPPLSAVSSPAPGLYADPVIVSLTCTDNCDAIYLTADGSDPWTGTDFAASAAVYGDPLPVEATTTLRFRARDLAGNVESSTHSATYTIATVLEVLSVSPAAVSETGFDHSTITWRVNRDDTFHLELEGTSCADALPWPGGSTGFAAAGVPESVDVAVADLALGLNTVRICLDGGTAEGAVGIRRETNPPEIVQFYLSPGGGAVAALPQIGFVLSAQDLEGPVYEMQLREGASPAPNAWRPYADTGLFTLSALNGLKTVRAWVRDAAGNVSAPALDTVTLEFDTYPNVRITQVTPGPSGVDIAWTCDIDSPGILATPPITRLAVSIDDGAHFTVIAQDLPDDNGTYAWSLPATVDGQQVTPSTPMRFAIHCAARTGVIANDLSDAVNTPWQVVLGEPRLLDDDIYLGLADVTAGQGTDMGIAADAAENLYYLRNAALMRIDSQSGTVSRWLGTPRVTTCNVGPGAPLDEVTLGPVNRLLGSLDGGAALLLHSCDQVFRVDISPPALTLLSAHAVWTAASSDGWSSYFLTSDDTLLAAPWYGTDVSRLYAFDLSTPEAAPTLITGDGSCTADPSPSIGLAALGLPFPGDPSAVNCGRGILIMADADASQIWLGNPQGQVRVRLDRVGPDYVLGGVGAWPYYVGPCTPVPYAPHLHCPGYVGIGIHTFDPATETLSATYTPPFVDPARPHSLALAASPNRLYARSALNALAAIDTYDPSSANWSAVILLDAELSHDGDLGAPQDAVIFHPLDVHHDRASGRTFVPLTASALRWFEPLAPTPTMAAIDAAPWGYTLYSLTADASGTRLALGSVGCQSEVSAALLDAGATVISGDGLYLHGNGSCGGATPGAYPAPDGAGAVDSSVYITSAHLPLYQRLVAHPNGNLYFATATAAGYDAIVYESDGLALHFVAGRLGAGGYLASDDGGPALAAGLERVMHLQEARGASSWGQTGDLWLFDGPRLRRLAMSADAGAGLDAGDLTTLIDYTSDPAFVTAGTDFTYDAWFDDLTGTTYWIDSQRRVFKHTLAGGTVAIDLSGTVLTGAPRLTVVGPPGGGVDHLLILQRDRMRVLRVGG